MTKRHALRVLICTLFLCGIEARAGGALCAQSVTPVGVRLRLSGGIAPAAMSSTLPIVATPATSSDSSGTERTRHAVIGTAVGIVVGAVIGYREGKAEDTRCGGECGGPPIASLVDSVFFGLVGGAIGAIVGYVFPT